MEFFYQIICVYEKKVVPLYRQRKNKFNQIKTKQLWQATLKNKW